MGADFVEPDLVSTRDSVLVARHENEIGGTTDAAARFPGRRATRTVDGARVTGWFVEDLHARRAADAARPRAPARRSHLRATASSRSRPSTRCSRWSRAARRELGRPVGCYRDQAPRDFRAIGLPLEERLVAALAGPGPRRPPGRVPGFVQSFAVASLSGCGGWPGAPARCGAVVAPRGPRRGPAYAAPAAHSCACRASPSYARTRTRSARRRRWCSPSPHGATLRPPTTLVADAHRAGLAVHVWTLRGDAPFLPAAYRGDPLAEWRRLAALGVHGISATSPTRAAPPSDRPARQRAARDDARTGRPQAPP
jgi:glycerophosphoryl diester phosphodiesterase